MVRCSIACRRLKPGIACAFKTRYTAELEHAFGSPDNVAAALDKLQALQSSPPKVLTEGALSQVKHWGKANATVWQTGLLDNAGADGCYFEVERVPF